MEKGIITQEKEGWPVSWIYPSPKQTAFPESNPPGMCRFKLSIPTLGFFEYRTPNHASYIPNKKVKGWLSLKWEAAFPA